jgi:hypothetical protein
MFVEHTEGTWVVNEKHPARSNDAEVIIEQKGERPYRDLPTYLW